MIMWIIIMAITVLLLLSGAAVAGMIAYLFWHMQGK